MNTWPSDQRHQDQRESRSGGGANHCRCAADRKYIARDCLDTSDPVVRFDEAHLHLLAGIDAPCRWKTRARSNASKTRMPLRSTLAIEHNMIGESAPAQEVYRFIQRVAPAKSAVLICGESGTGKELAAHAIHTNSPRAAQPFAPINCAALPDTLLESELFGHERGAFTGAVGRKQGKLEVAHSGTVFLDEIGEMPLTMQRSAVASSGSQSVRLGGTRPINPCAYRATNRNLEEMIKTGTFRDNLYHRLNVVKITQPPLPRTQRRHRPFGELLHGEIRKECSEQ
jgi:transcriptional regulator with GAF, ATPase, and Fis domain